MLEAELLHALHPLENTLAVVPEIVVVHLEAEGDGLHVQPSARRGALEKGVAHQQPLGGVQLRLDLPAVDFQQAVRHGISASRLGMHRRGTCEKGEDKEDQQAGTGGTGHEEIRLFDKYSTNPAENQISERQVNKKGRRGNRSGRMENRPDYLVTRSSQRTIESMTSIDRPQAATNTAHVAHIGVWR